ncbi:MAG: CDP-alcohol phosphatidyltransferase family protein [Bacteroidota bacterium]|nr:CDP-alcohol phosphatidyltransferase family protein [Bacteroidota bacterium]
MNKQVPNTISILRIILSLGLFWVIKTKLPFVGLVFVIGLSDVADGYIARKYKLVTKKGAQLDSIADLVFFIALLIILFIRYDWVIRNNLGLLLLVLVVKVTTVVVSKIRHGKIVFIHTYANKLTGFVIFLVIMILPFEVSPVLIKGVFGLAILAAIEELVIILKYKEINLNQKSIWKE